MVLKPWAAGTTREGDSRELEEPTEPKDDEESDGEIEEGIVEFSESDETDPMAEPEWDVDSFDGVEYYSSPEPDLPSDEQPYDKTENAGEHYRIYKRQLIDSKGFMVDPGLRPSDLYKGIKPLSFEGGGANRKTFREYCEEMVSICLEKHNQDKPKDSNVEFVEMVRGNYRGGPRPKSYITFMAREKPDGDVVEYQAKGMATLDGKKHPILCRPAPTPKADLMYSFTFQFSFFTFLLGSELRDLGIWSIIESDRRRIEREFEEAVESMEASSTLEDAAESIEISSPVVVDSCLMAKLELEEEEESDGETEEDSDEKPKIEEPEAEIPEVLQAPEWDVDSFDGLEYYSSPEILLSSSYSDEEEAEEHYRIAKRQLIDSKGFYMDPELKRVYFFKRISAMPLDMIAFPGKTFRDYWEEMVHVCVQKHNQDKDPKLEFVEVVRGNYRGGRRSKSYITFLAREKPYGDLVEYQAKAMATFDGKSHPILCRPAPMPKPI
ncbi:unnamed protein product [Microthlaspi erraticum]|uniref:Cystatin domain-containing protein n=1 Tax=Microthlaspi erraticum TaxID=1685480 RepID=A0A6D2K4M7_9BRAS|nr:unnamed protein product [Microthlaspi erraticum]